MKRTIMCVTLGKQYEFTFQVNKTGLVEIVDTTNDKGLYVPLSVLEEFVSYANRDE